MSKNTTNNTYGNLYPSQNGMTNIGPTPEEYIALRAQHETAFKAAQEAVKEAALILEEAGVRGPVGSVLTLLTTAVTTLLA